MPARPIHKFNKAIAAKIGERWKKALKTAEPEISQEEFTMMLRDRGYKTLPSTVSRFFDGAESAPHLMQAIARLFEELGVLTVPADYKASPVTDYLLDLTSGRMSLDTLKVGKVADVFEQESVVNKNRRHGSDRPEKTVQPIASIPEETISKSGASAVGTKEGVAILKKAINGRSLEEISARYGVSFSKLQLIMEGQAVPDLIDMGRLGPLLVEYGNSVLELMEAYNRPDNSED